MPPSPPMPPAANLQVYRRYRPVPRPSPSPRRPSSPRLEKRERWPPCRMTAARRPERPTLPKRPRSSDRPARGRRRTCVQAAPLSQAVMTLLRWTKSRAVLPCRYVLTSQRWTSQGRARSRLHLSHLPSSSSSLPECNTSPASRPPALGRRRSSRYGSVRLDRAVCRPLPVAMAAPVDLGVAR